MCQMCPFFPFLFQSEASFQMTWEGEETRVENIWGKKGFLRSISLPSFNNLNISSITRGACLLKEKYKSSKFNIQCAMGVCTVMLCGIYK